MRINVDGFQRGRGELEIPIGATLDCIANYGGEAQIHCVIVDPKAAQNPYWSVHQIFDKNFKALQAALNQQELKASASDDMEVAVAWLLPLRGNDSLVGWNRYCLVVNHRLANAKFGLGRNA